MKKEKVVYRVDSFMDYAGITREFIFAAVSVPLENCDVIDFTSNKEVQKEVRIGVSVQRAGDTINTERGKVIAYGKAMKDKSCVGKLYTTDKGMINAKLVDALLEQEAEYFKNRPGKYLASYDRDMQNWLNEE